MLLLAFCWTMGTTITIAQENFCLENGVTADYIKDVVYPNNDYSFSKISNYYNKTTNYRKDLPYPVRLSVPNTNEGSSLLLETYYDGKLVRSDKYAVGEKLLEIWNLIPQTSYFYKLYILYANNTKKEVASGSFRTEGQVRMMNIDKMRNFRDLGGWKLPNDQRVKYDKIFRSAEPATTSQAITKAGIDEMINVQKIQVEIDFASPYSNTSPLSGYLEHVHGSEYELTQYVDGLKSYRTQYKNCFQKMLNSLRAGKKVLFHCVYGADRTGTFALLLEGLLGVSESDLAKDYELTNFYHAPRLRTANSKGYKETIDYIKNTFSGSTINDKIQKMAISFGISQKDINEFRSLMIESNVPTYALTYIVDGEIYKTYQLQKGKAITPEPIPTKEGYTFSGWSEIPETMPAENVTVIGSFELTPVEDVIKIEKSGFTLYYGKYDLDFTNVEGISAYTATAFNPKYNQLKLTRVDDAPAGTGLMLKGEPEKEYHIPFTESKSYYLNMLKGDAENDMTVSKIEGEYTNFFMDEDGQIVPFDDEISYPAGKCYLQIPTRLLEESANARSIEYVFEDEDETITDISSTALEKDNVIYYNLQGQRADKPTKGLYIVNGRKVVIR